MRKTYVVMRPTDDGGWEVLYHGRPGESHRAFVAATQDFPNVRVAHLTSLRFHPRG